MNRVLESKKETLLGMLPHFFDNYLHELPVGNRDRLLEVAENTLLKKGNLSTYITLLNELPKFDGVELSENGRINLELPTKFINDVNLKKIKNTVLRLIPWRKGPFNFFGCEVNTEWNSALKWHRLGNRIEDLRGRLVLDVGSGNGYFAFRMVLEGARAVLCLEPSLQSFVQFRFCKHFLSDKPVEMLPLRSEHVKFEKRMFDTVFSMGVLYHNREPKNHLEELRRYLRLGGQLVLDTLINTVERASILVPSGRYASMRNGWCVPSKQMVLDWLSESGFKDPHCIDISTTTTAEQRSTEMMPYHSLSDGLDQIDSSVTTEGYERPIRGVFLANAS